MSPVNLSTCQPVCQVYLNNLQPQFVIIRVALLIEDKSESFVPVDLELVHVVICQAQPHLGTQRDMLNVYLYLTVYLTVCLPA